MAKFKLLLENHLNTNSRFKLFHSVISNSSDETEAVGQAFGKTLQKGQIIGLVGDLGAGKTCFTRGLYKGRNAGFSVTVNSPTFVVMQRYLGDLTFYHADVYRLNSILEFLDLGLFELSEDGVLIVEWADKFLEAFPEEAILIEFLHKTETSRTINYFKN